MKILASEMYIILKYKIKPSGCVWHWSVRGQFQEEVANGECHSIAGAALFADSAMQDYIDDQLSHEEPEEEEDRSNWVHDTDMEDQ